MRLYRTGLCKTRVKTQCENGRFDMSWATICAWYAAGYRYFIAYDATTGWYIYAPLTMRKASCSSKLGVIPTGKKRPVIVFKVRVNKKSKYMVWKNRGWATNTDFTRSQYYLAK